MAGYHPSEDGFQFPLHLYYLYGCDGDHLPVLFRTEDLYHKEGIDEETRKILSIQNFYESMWIERGLNIKYQKFALSREGELVEPDVEIQLDDYRSYRRDKRKLKGYSEVDFYNDLNKLPQCFECLSSSVIGD